MKYVFTYIFVIILSILPMKSLDGEISFVETNHTTEDYAELFIKERHKELMLQAIITVESNGKLDAYNKREQAVGILQIRPIMLKHANKIIGYEKYSLEDRWSKDKSIEIFWIVQESHNPTMSLDQACHIWNAGIADKRKWEITEKYRNLVLNQYNRLLSNFF